MATMTEAFRAFINEANKNLGMVTEPAKKAEICASLALAIATTGFVTEVPEEVKATVESTPVQETKPTGHEALAKKSNIKVEAKPEVVKVEEESKKETPKERDVTVDDTWEDEYWINHFAKECEYLQKAVEEYGEEEVNEAVKLFSQGNYQSVDDIQPFNIVAFVTYLKELTEEA